MIEVTETLCVQGSGISLASGLAGNQATQGSRFKMVLSGFAVSVVPVSDVNAEGAVITLDEVANLAAVVAVAALFPSPFVCRQPWGQY